MKHLQSFEQLNESRWTASSTEGDFDWDKLDKDDKFTDDERNKLLNKTIGSIHGFDTRTLNIFNKIDIKTIGDLLKFTFRDLHKVRYFGKKVRANIVDTLETIGLELDSQ